MRLRHVPPAILAWAAASLAWFAGAAHATPLLAPHVGGGVFVGPVDASVTALYWNPAAAGLMSGTHVHASGGARLDFTRIERATISTSDGEPNAAGDRSFAPVSVSPISVDNFVGVVSDLSSNDVTVGLAVYAPYAENLPNVDALAYHASGGLFYGETVTVGLSYRVEPWLTIGATGNLLFTHVRMQFWRDTALEGCTAAPCGLEDAAKAEKYDLDAGFWSFPTIYVGLGAVLRLGDWYLGLAGSNLLAGTSLNRSDGSATVTTTDGATLRGRSSITLELPLTLDLGARRRVFPGWDLVLGARFVHLASQDKVDLRLFGQELARAAVPDWIVRYRGLGDVYWFEAGLEEPPAQRLRLGARLRVSSGGVPASAVAIDQLDAPSADLSAGLEVRLADRVGLDVSYTLSLLLPRDVGASAFSPAARIACNSAQFDITTPGCVAVREGRAIPTAAGSYLRVGNALTLGLSYDVW